MNVAEAVGRALVAAGIDQVLGPGRLVAGGGVPRALGADAPTSHLMRTRRLAPGVVTGVLDVPRLQLHVHPMSTTRAHSGGASGT